MLLNVESKLELIPKRTHFKHTTVSYYRASFSIIRLHEIIHKSKHLWIFNHHALNFGMHGRLCDGRLTALLHLLVLRTLLVEWRDPWTHFCVHQLFIKFVIQRFSNCSLNSCLNCRRIFHHHFIFLILFLCSTVIHLELNSSIIVFYCVASQFFMVFDKLTKAFVN